MEYVSLMRWVSLSGRAILDLDKNGTVRNLEEKERSYMHKISNDLSILFKSMEAYDESYVMTMSHREKAKYFSEIDKTIQNIKNTFFAKDNPEGEFRMENKTMYSIQSWILDIEKWMATQRGSLGRNTIQTRENDFDGN